MRILVTGGSGTLGSAVMVEASRRGHEATSASRRTGVDLGTGVGLAEALAGADAVVHCATRPQRARKVDVDGTRHLMAAFGGDQHLVYISIVGCDQNPLGYYRAKAQAEQIIADSGRPATIARATQFHSLARMMASALTFGPVTVTLGDLAFQSCDVGWVAGRLVDHAESAAPAGCVRATDLAGPERFTQAEIAALLRQSARHRPPRRIRVPALGGTLRAFSTGTNLPGDGAETGGRGFTEWLAAELGPAGPSAT